ncbi:ABC transporter inner membrane protein [Bordetella pertussis]|nr:ABC transporter inner membrane protein [Bordetella pertussis]
MIDPFLVVANAMPKIAFVPTNKMKLAYTFGASRWQVLTKVILPGSVPTLIAAVKMNIGLALVGVIVGEFQSADLGLGFLIMNGSQIFKLNIVMTAITLLALISSVMYLVIYRLEAAVARRYA